ncbi:MAG: carbonic anhydrase family protein [Cytophagaceae bacterium]|jgi:carbonic anhydrase
MWTRSKEELASLTPEKALEILVEGNKRFVNNYKINRNLLQQVNETSDTQLPIAIILSCIDSRTSSELIFDQGLGDIFNARVAGNVINEDILGSMEYACKVVGSKLILVLGHTKCGAVKGACNDVKLGNLTQLLAKIEPAVAFAKTEPLQLADQSVFTEKVAKANVLLTMADIKRKSPVLNELIVSGAIKLVGGMQNIESGKVDLFTESGENILKHEMKSELKF